MSVYYQGLKYIKDYIITVEKGTTGHQHLDSFVQLTETKRQDKFRESVIKSLYKHIPKEELRNIKCVVNYLDPDPMYAIGYALKENPEIILTSYKQDYLQRSEEYYRKNQERVSQLKDEAKAKYKGRILTLDNIADAYLEYCHNAGYDTMYYMTSQDWMSTKHIHADISFKKFMVIYEDYIPFSIYQKINQDKLIEWCDAYLQKKGGVS